VGQALSPANRYFREITKQIAGSLFPFLPYNYLEAQRYRVTP
jgi:hypothetical protein